MNDMFMQRIMMALVRKAGGHVVLNENELWEGGNIKMTFDPPVGRDPIECDHSITIDVSDYEDDDDREYPDLLASCEDVDDPWED